MLFYFPGPTFYGSVEVQCVSSLEQVRTLNVSCTGPFARAADGTCRIKCPCMLFHAHSCTCLHACIHTFHCTCKHMQCWLKLSFGSSCVGPREHTVHLGTYWQNHHSHRFGVLGKLICALTCVRACACVLGCFGACMIAYIRACMCACLFFPKYFSLSLP